MQSNNLANKKSNRRTLVVVLLIFALPSIFAMSLYFSGWRPVSTANHGELIQPARLIEDRDLQTIDGKSVRFSAIRGKWSMVYFDTADCSEECMKKIYFMRQIHIAQGKNQEKLQRVMILTEAKTTNNLKLKLADYPEMQVWKGDKEVISQLARDFGMSAKTDVMQHNIYLLDPRGNLMMRYATGIDPAGIRKDLDRLLKYSSEQ